MKTIKIKKEDFKELYNSACDPWKNKFNEKFKNLLFDENLEFDENFLLEMKNACTSDQLPIFSKLFKNYLPENLIDKIKTYQDVCDILKEEPKKTAYDKIKQIEKLFNQGWIKNWEDKTQYKYYPYYTIDSPGFLVFDSSLGAGGFRAEVAFCFRLGSFSAEVAFYKNREVSDYVGKTFIDIYQELANS